MGGAQSFVAMLNLLHSTLWPQLFSFLLHTEYAHFLPIWDKVQYFMIFISPDRDETQGVAFKNPEYCDLRNLS